MDKRRSIRVAILDEKAELLQKMISRLEEQGIAVTSHRMLDPHDGHSAPWEVDGEQVWAGKNPNEEPPTHIHQTTRKGAEGIRQEGQIRKGTGVEGQGDGVFLEPGVKPSGVFDGWIEKKDIPNPPVKVETYVPEGKARVGGFQWEHVVRDPNDVKLAPQRVPMTEQNRAIILYFDEFPELERAWNDIRSWFPEQSGEQLIDMQAYVNGNEQILQRTTDADGRVTVRPATVWAQEHIFQDKAGNILTAITDTHTPDGSIPRGVPIQVAADFHDLVKDTEVPFLNGPKDKRHYQARTRKSEDGSFWFDQDIKVVPRSPGKFERPSVHSEMVRAQKDTLTMANTSKALFVPADPSQPVVFFADRGMVPPDMGMPGTLLDVDHVTTKGNRDYKFSYNTVRVQVPGVVGRDGLPMADTVLVRRAHDTLSRIYGEHDPIRFKVQVGAGAAPTAGPTIAQDAVMGPGPQLPPLPEQPTAPAGIV